MGDQGIRNNDYCCIDCMVVCDKRLFEEAIRMAIYLKKIIKISIIY